MKPTFRQALFFLFIRAPWLIVKIGLLTAVRFFSGAKTGMKQKRVWKQRIVSSEAERLDLIRNPDKYRP